MTWATQYIERLKRGREVTCRFGARSLRPRIDPGNMVTLAPCRSTPLAAGDVVFCDCAGRPLFGHITTIGADEHGRTRYRIRTGRWSKFWTSRANIYAVVTKVEP